MPIFRGYASAAMMNLDAAYEIVKQTGESLRCEQITERALEQHLISPQDVTPEAMIYRGLSHRWSTCETRNWRHSVRSLTL